MACPNLEVIFLQRGEFSEVRNNQSAKTLPECITVKTGDYRRCSTYFSKMTSRFVEKLYFSLSDHFVVTWERVDRSFSCRRWLVQFVTGYFYFPFLDPQFQLVEMLLELICSDFRIRMRGKNTHHSRRLPNGCWGRSACLAFTIMFCPGWYAEHPRQYRVAYQERLVYFIEINSKNKMYLPIRV